MKIGAYSFAVSGRIEKNLQKMKSAVSQATAQGVQLLVFPECALTGYPPRDVPSSQDVDFEKAECAMHELHAEAQKNGVHVILGSITKENGRIFNSALFLSKEGGVSKYHKRALWGWDRDHFAPGDEDGVFELDGLRIGVRICYEIRFPEYFRELYREKTDLNVVLFYDVADRDGFDRYDLIKAHIRTRAVENVCPILTANAIAPYQTAPTGFYDASGGILCETERNREELLTHDLQIQERDFGERGRIEISDFLQKQ